MSSSNNGDVWSKNETLRFIASIKGHECLWNPLHGDFNNEHLKRSIILDIINDLKIEWLTESIAFRNITLLTLKYRMEHQRKVLKAGYKCPLFWYPVVDSFMGDVANIPEWLFTSIQSTTTSKMSLLEFAVDIWKPYANLDMKAQRQFRQNMQTALNQLLDEQ